MARAHINDLDFREGFVTLHERKKSRETKTTRRVPMPGLFKRVMRAWVKGRSGPLFSVEVQPVATTFAAARSEGRKGFDRIEQQTVRPKRREYQLHTNIEGQMSKSANPTVSPEYYGVGLARRSSRNGQLTVCPRKRRWCVSRLQIPRGRR